MIVYLLIGCKWKAGRVFPWLEAYRWRIRLFKRVGRHSRCGLWQDFPIGLPVALEIVCCRSAGGGQ